MAEVLIGAIVATEFAMAFEYPEGEFAHNALVFAPGKTILEALRELAEIPYDHILPPRFYKPFAASVKLTFTRKSEALLERIIAASSEPGDLTLDCFIGSGTTAVVAQRLGRRWIGCDINKGAIQVTSKRLQADMSGAFDILTFMTRAVMPDTAPTAPGSTRIKNSATVMTRDAPRL